MRMVTTVWRLKHGLEKKFSRGHPWVFSSDLDQSPKGHAPGNWVELRSSRDEFLAFGYGHPSTLIAFRTLALTPIRAASDAALAPMMIDHLREVLARAASLRNVSGVDRWSHRLVFGEADGLPGVIVDRYFSPSPALQIFVVQASTAGADRLLPYLTASLSQFRGRDLAFGGAAGNTNGHAPMGVVVAQDSSSRAIEGLQKEPRRASGDWAGVDPRKVTIAVKSGESALGEAAPVLYDVNFIEAQKTGFFLDQRTNIRMSWPLLRAAAERAAREDRVLRVLDLFCHVGQWSVQAARAASDVVAGSKDELKIELTMADASAAALAMAKLNAERAGAAVGLNAVVETKKMDILEGIQQLPVGTYDIVICDPPAFMKKKKDEPTAAAAYFKLNREAIRRVRPGGVFVSCSCSGLLAEDEFAAILAKARSASGREITWLARGGHGEDHPYRSEFPQGRYLKGWVGVVS